MSNKKNNYLTIEQLALYMDINCKDYTHKSEIVITPTTLCAMNIEKWKVKPILRPLNDMTENEVCNLIELRSNMFHYIKKVSVTNHALKFEFQYASSSRRRIQYQNFDKLSPQQFVYLLLCGFDLFNWIEQKLALDKTKLK